VAQNRLTSLLLPGSDPLRRMTAVEHQKADGTAILSSAYAYDAAGQLISATGGAGAPAALSYGYDTTGQLTGVSSGNQSQEAFAYDAAGNRLAANSGLQTSNCTISPSNRVASDGIWNYGYDDEGNLISKINIANPNIQTSYAYDHRNRLVSVVQTLSDLSVSAVNVPDRMGSVQAVTDAGGGVLESYSYSAFGVRSIAF